MFTERASKYLVISGLIVIFLGLYLFLYKGTFDTKLAFDNSKIGQFGDFIGGVVGAIWSLAGVVLFYLALQDQKKDIEINRNTLNQQIEEFKLQRLELEKTRDIYIQQSNLLKIQRFENTFFQLVNLYHDIIGNINLDFNGRVYEKREVFNFSVENLKSAFGLYTNIYKNDLFGGRIIVDQKPTNNLFEVQALISDTYTRFYNNDTKQVLSHYFRSVYHVFKFIFNSPELSKEEKQFYASIFRSQLSSNELFLILYNSIHDGLGYPKFLFLIKEFDILQNFDFELISDFKFHFEVYNEKLRDVVALNL